MTKCTCDIQFDEDDNVVIFTVKGQPVHNDIRNCFEQAIRSAEFKPEMSRIWDYSQADLSEMDSEGIKTLTDLSVKPPAGMEKVRVAIVSERGINLVLLRLYKMLRADLPESTTQTEAFESMETARKWACNKNP